MRPRRCRPTLAARASTPAAGRRSWCQQTGSARGTGVRSTPTLFTPSRVRAAGGRAGAGQGKARRAGSQGLGVLLVDSSLPVLSLRALQSPRRTCLATTPPAATTSLSRRRRRSRRSSGALRLAGRCSDCPAVARMLHARPAVAEPPLRRPSLLLLPPCSAYLVFEGVDSAFYCWLNGQARLCTGIQKLGRRRRAAAARAAATRRQSHNLLSALRPPSPSPQHHCCCSLWGTARTVACPRSSTSRRCSSRARPTRWRCRRAGAGGVLARPLLRLASCLACYSPSCLHAVVFVCLFQQVLKWSDGSYLEDQDQWWLSGIHRCAGICICSPGHALMCCARRLPTHSQRSLLPIPNPSAGTSTCWPSRPATLQTFTSARPSPGAQPPGGRRRPRGARALGCSALPCCAVLLPCMNRSQMGLWHRLT